MSVYRVYTSLPRVLERTQTPSLRNEKETNAAVLESFQKVSRSRVKSLTVMPVRQPGVTGVNIFVRRPLFFAAGG